MAVLRTLLLAGVVGLAAAQTIVKDGKEIGM